MTTNASETKAERDLEPLWADIEHIMTGMVTTLDEGLLRSRPMLAFPDKADGALYFFTRADDHKVEEVQRDPRVCVSFVDTKNEIYVSVTGRGSVVADREKARQHATAAAVAWFDDGLDDVNLRLLRVDIEQAERWDVTTNPLRKLWEIALAFETERTPDLAENRKFQVDD